jgi:hypothetical protein
LLGNLSRKRYSIIFLNLNIVINNQTINTTTSADNNSLNTCIRHLAIAISLLLLSSILLVSIASPFDAVIAKRCSDESTSVDSTSSSCASQDSNSFSHSQSGNDNGNDNNEAIPFKHTKKYFNHESHDGDSENDTPFSLPFP